MFWMMVIVFVVGFKSHFFVLGYNSTSFGSPIVCGVFPEVDHHVQEFFILWGNKLRVIMPVSSSLQNVHGDSELISHHVYVLIVLFAILKIVISFLSLVHIPSHPFDAMYH